MPGRAIIESRDIATHPLAVALQQQGWEILPQYDATSRPNADLWLVDMYRSIKQPVKFRANVAHARRHGIPVLAWNRDAPWNRGAKTWRLWLIRQLRYLDIYLSHSMQGARDFAPECHYFPNAADIGRYHLNGATLADMRHPEWYKFDVSFIGNIDAGRYPELRQRVALLQQICAQLQTLGISVRIVNARDLSVNEQIHIIQRSRINLNVGAACDDGPEPSWGLPERCYGIPACGGLLLSDWRLHAADDFCRDHEWLDFRSIDECIGQIQWLLTNLQRARNIADAAHQRVMNQHTYVHRTRQLLQWVTAWKQRGS